ncbi:MAG TPA: hypothetical protein VEY69_10570, partial [Lautropia sp.]|nr:hypothetical protein [Lautropia sp.]
MSFLHHPIFQSLLLPLLLSLAGIALLRALSGPTLAAAAVGLSVLLATIWLMGWSPQPGSLLQKLPWIFAGAWLVGVALNVTVQRRLVQWVILTAAWLAASWWIGYRGPGFALVAGMTGAGVIACLVYSPDDRADGVSAAVIAALGLAGVTFAAGSLALFQLGLLLAAALGGAGLWLWPKPRIRFGVAAVALASIAWLALAQASLLLIAVSPAAIIALAAAFLAAPVLAWIWPRRRTVTAPIAAALLAGAVVAGAV